MKSFIKDDIPFTVVIESVLLAFFIDIRAINWTLVYGFSFSEGLMNLLYPACVGLILVIFPFQKSLSKTGKFNKTSIFLVIYLLFYYFFTSIIIGEPHIPMLMFGVTTISAFILPQLVTIHVPLFLKTTMALPFLAILRLDSVFASIVDWDMQLSMDTSYAFLIPIIANIVYLAKYFRSEIGIIPRALTIIFSAINLTFLLLMLQFGSRGPLVCVVSLIVWLYLCEFPNGMLTINYKRLKVVFTVIIVFLIFGIALLSYFDTLLKSMNFEISAISKILSLNEAGDISNGRRRINGITLSGIWNSPLFGWGLDRFDANTGLGYPHNFILQTLYDGGIWLFCILYIPIIRSFKNLIRHQDIHQFAYISALFFASVPGALFSQNLWAIPALWACFGTIMSTSIYSKE